MKVIKISFFVILGFFLILTIVGFLQPATVQIQVEKVIKAPVCQVFDRVNNMEHRLRWSAVENLDSNIITNLGDIIEGEGASYTWANKESGAMGGVKYVDVQDERSIVSSVAYGETGEAAEDIRFTEVDDGTRITWFYRQEMGGNPFARIMGVFIKESFRPIYIENLNRLDNDIKTNPELPLRCNEALSAISGP